MYRYLDRAARDLDAIDRLLVWSMRSWVATLSSGRCPCSALGPVFAGWGLEAMLPDFNTAMLILNGEGQAGLHFGAVCCARVSDDEARLLVLFAAGREGGKQIRRLADQIVQPIAVSHLVTAVERVTAMLAEAPVLWDAPGREG